MNGAHVKRGEQGFVLPYVLVVIAILAIAGTIAAQRLTKAAGVVDDMGEHMRAERLLHSAEVAATFSILSGNIAANGYDLAPDSPIVWEFGLLSADGRRPLREDAAENIPRNVWGAAGELRRWSPEAEGRAHAIIAYRDAAGLVPLNEGNPKFLRPVLEAVGASPGDARDLVDSLRDFIDPDDNRRTHGAESFDYRTQKMMPPPNGPLRSYSELGNIMGWAETIQKLDMQALKDMTTLKLTAGYGQSFSGAELRQILGYGPNTGEDSLHTGRNLGLLEQIALNTNRPSKFARFTIWVPRADGRYQKRVVDIERFLGGVGEPYRRDWVYDSVVLETDLNPYVDASILRAGRPPNFDELDHVVHAPALRP